MATAHGPWREEDHRGSFPAPASGIARRAATALRCRLLGQQRGQATDRAVERVPGAAQLHPRRQAVCETLLPVNSLSVKTSFALTDAGRFE